MIGTTARTHRKPSAIFLTYAQKSARHQVLDRIISFLENKQIEFRGVKLPSVFPAQTIRQFESMGWNANDIYQSEQSVFRDAEFNRNARILQDVPAALHYELKKDGRESLIFDSRAVSIPGNILNALICSELKKIFPIGDLKICGIFKQTRDFDANGKLSEIPRIDIDSNLARRGFIVPVMNSGLIYGLRVFRHPHDERPFILRTRSEVKNSQ